MDGGAVFWQRVPATHHSSSWSTLGSQREHGEWSMQITQSSLGVCRWVLRRRRRWWWRSGGRRERVSRRRLVRKELWGDILGGDVAPAQDVNPKKLLHVFISSPKWFIPTGVLWSWDLRLLPQGCCGVEISGSSHRGVVEFRSQAPPTGVLWSWDLRLLPQGCCGAVGVWNQLHVQIGNN